MAKKNTKPCKLIWFCCFPPKNNLIYICKPFDMVPVYVNVYVRISYVQYIRISYEVFYVYLTYSYVCTNKIYVKYSYDCVRYTRTFICTYVRLYKLQ